jgi:tetratricopeptide (TPR) repeat protein
MAAPACPTRLSTPRKKVSQLQGPSNGAEGELSAALALLEQLRPAVERGDRARQVGIVGQLIESRAPMGGQWREVAQLAASNGELGLARAAIDLLAEASGGDAMAQYQKAGMLFELGALPEAEAAMREVPADVPDPIGHAYSRGVMALYLGRPGDARPQLEQVTSARPQSGTAWLALAMMADLAEEPALAERIVAAEQTMARAVPAERGAYFYALGKVHADRDDPASAFAAFARGAQHMKAVAAYNRELERRLAADAVRDYSPGRIADLARQQSEPTGRTIFVTGPPRSGSTLVEQILTSHSAVGGGAELSRMVLLAKEVGGASHAAVARYVESQGAAPAAQLWHHWLDQWFAASGRIVDKSIDSSRYLGLAASLLPDAPLIWTTRDPLDRAWSCFRTNFLAGALPWSYDLEAIAEHFRLEDRLLGQWMQVLGDRLLLVPYEALVADPATWTRRILAHCGLAEEPQVFVPHQNQRVVVTASTMQVRRPIHREGIGAAEPYRAFLEPFVKAYYR